MIRSPHRARALRVAGLVCMAVFAVLPFYGRAGATPLDEDLQQLTARLEELRTRFVGGELTPAAVRQQAERIIDLKRAFVLSSERKGGVFLEPYLDLAEIDEALEKAVKRAGRAARAKQHLDEAIAATEGLVRMLRARSDAGAYETAIGCLDRLAVTQHVLAQAMRDGEVKERAFGRRASALIERKTTCIGEWPLVFGRNFLVIYDLLKGIDAQLEKLSDRHDDGDDVVVQSVERALEKARALAGEVAAWQGTGTPPPSPTPSRSPSVFPSVTIRPTAGTSPSPGTSPTTSPPATQTPTPEESPTGINPKPPNLSGITAVFNSETHVTTYSVSASDPDGDQLTFTWTKSEERECGTFGGNGSTAAWNHSEPPCPEESPHPGTINVFVSDGTYTCSAFYEGGSASGSGPPAECGGAPRP